MPEIWNAGQSRRFTARVVKKVLPRPVVRWLQRIRLPNGEGAVPGTVMPDQATPQAAKHSTAPALATSALPAESSQASPDPPKSRRVSGVPMEVTSTEQNFDERDYLAANPDVAAAVNAGQLPNGRAHFDQHGRREGRRQRVFNAIDGLQREKLARIAPLLRLELPHQKRGAKYDFLTDQLRQATGITDTTAVSENGYDPFALAQIDEFADGIILDCGAGRRSTYFPNVVNYEIVDYKSTDVIGVGECLPFKNDSFDAVFSLAVLEHVRDPFACAAEIVRVLKPGGKLLCCVPFLQPMHGYPHHYYNMTSQGLRALFERKLHIDDQKVVESIRPIWSLTWIIKSWADGLQGSARDQFLSTTLRDLLAPPADFLEKSWVRSLPEEKNFELASATLLFARKPAQGSE